ncbi:MAG: hypothetical protein GQ563_08015 [Desulfuromusa sp.]|nr:hypothetical protein [Desulfuromusa sp.]
MTPWKLLDTAQIPGTDTELCLYQSDDHFSINIKSGGQLMNTLEHESEDSLAMLTCSKIAEHPQPRVLIGGLGMGFTLAAALRHLGANAEVVVGELVPAVVRWNQGPLGEHAGHPLQDVRTRVRVGDVAKILRAERKTFDAILLDVDNGPEGLTRKKNNWLYSMDGLTESYTALRPKGILAVWSAGPDRDFMERLRKVGFTVKQVRVRSDGKQGDLHAIWLAERGP